MTADETQQDETGDDTSNETSDELPSISTVELVVMVVSVVFTVSLFLFATWQAVTGAGMAAPVVGVTETSVEPGGTVVYTLELRNPGSVGLVRATVSAACASPPVTLTFENVPAGGRRVGTVVCPAGTTDPQLTVESWVHE
ncbi:hypothetical protein [Halorarius litoreus]|uniref:hypothetical protein n=1 Tax=Halorarius litoreus TaxID=2962676 RepID=UPI0020CC761B|nr:hypothetical protein [Halorarius litoreus]